jgi:hypothetical protein
MLKSKRIKPLLCREIARHRSQLLCHLTLISENHHDSIDLGLMNLEQIRGDSDFIVEPGISLLALDNLYLVDIILLHYSDKNDFVLIHIVIALIPIST